MSFARAVSRTSDVDFDTIPSPRSGFGRKSMDHASSKVPGSSRLSDYYTTHDVDQNGAMDDHGGPPAQVEGKYDYEGDSWAKDDVNDLRNVLLRHKHPLRHSAILTFWPIVETPDS